MNEQDRQDLFQLVSDSRDAIVCSIDKNGFPNAKTMYLRKHDQLHTFWFSTNVSASRTQDWLDRPNACIYFYDEKNIHGLMLTGHIQVCTDNETKKAFWRKGDEEYYPLGPSDPDYCMLRFTAKNANYWGSQKHLFSVDAL